MASATSDQIHTGWWQRHICVNIFSRVAFDSTVAGICTRDLLITLTTQLHIS